MKMNVLKQPGGNGSKSAARNNGRGDLVRVTLRKRSKSFKFASILVPIDFSAESKKALAYAVPFARQFGAKLTLLHVLEPVATPDFAKSFPLAMEDDKVMAKCRRYLERVVEDGGIESALVEKSLVRFGRAYDEIASAARTLKVDLIIISTHGYTGLKHALLGSTTERVVRHAPCPVLVVRSNQRDFVANRR